MFHHDMQFSILYPFTFHIFSTFVSFMFQFFQLVFHKFSIIYCVSIYIYHPYIFYSIDCSHSFQFFAPLFHLVVHIIFHMSSKIHWIGLRNKLQETPIFNGKKPWFPVDFPLKSIEQYREQDRSRQVVDSCCASRHSALKQMRRTGSDLEVAVAIFGEANWVGYLWIPIWFWFGY